MLNTYNTASIENLTPKELDEFSDFAERVEDTQAQRLLRELARAARSHPRPDPRLQLAFGF